MSGIIGGGKVKSGVVGGGFLGEPHQSWQSVLASRADNTYYTNTTGSPIFVYISVISSSYDVNIYVNNTTIGYAAGNGRASWSYIVPNGQNYKINATTWSDVYKWHELR